MRMKQLAGADINEDDDKYTLNPVHPTFSKMDDTWGWSEEGTYMEIPEDDPPEELPHTPNPHLLEEP